MSLTKWDNSSRTNRKLRATIPEDGRLASDPALQGLIFRVKSSV